MFIAKCFVSTNFLYMLFHYEIFVLILCCVDNLSYKYNPREGHGAMVRAWRSADVAACRAVSNLLGAGFSEKYHVSPLSILGHC